MPSLARRGRARALSPFLQDSVRQAAEGKGKGGSTPDTSCHSGMQWPHSPKVSAPAAEQIII